MTYPAGFMDANSFPKTNKNFRLLYDTKGRFKIHAIKDEEAKFKLCKVRFVQFGQKGIPYLNTYDGRTIHYPDPLIRANDTIKVDLEINKIIDFIKFNVGNVVMVTGGCYWSYATRLGNVFTIGYKAMGLSSQGLGYQAHYHEVAKKRAAAQGDATA
ncbi:40S ribosomal protein S4 [Thalictrum thalictroides]|uniref:40S ribosomal protein S4 n=1 Tax=Thalictrum thalictroides TaxID=46969 RepID=A0A7J6X2V1_THATH|nr:40S ribosomal protein S4 [Thalictrum thalictroides]